MGLDFIHQKKRAFRKMFDGGREALASPDLLPSEEDWEDQQVLFEVPRDCSLVDGDDLVVQISGSRLVALRGQDVVATAENPPESVVTAIKQAQGYVLASVVRFSSLSSTADLAFRLH